MAIVLRRLVPLVLLALIWAPAAYAWSWPVQGPVLQAFSFDPAHPYAAGQHRGIDIGASTGASVTAPAAGTVSFAGTVPTSGLCVTIETADGYSVTLTHLGTILVSRGAAVGEGDAVGTVGPSGTADFDVPYVHLGIRMAADPNGYVDPLTLLPALPPSAPDASGPPAVSSAPPAETTPATPTATAPAAPAPARAVSVASSVAPAAHDPAVPVSRPAPAKPVVRATTEKPAEAHSRPATVRAPVRPQSRAATEDGAGRAHGGWEPQPAAGAPVSLRHRPVPVPAPAREESAPAGTEVPVAPLALGAGASAAAAVALLAVLLLRRRRPGPASAPGAVVIPLRRPEARREERRAA